MKKAAILTLSALMFSTVPLTTASAVNNIENVEKDSELKKANKYFKSVEELNGEKIYVYKYKNIEFTGNVEFSEEEIAEKFEEVESMSTKSPKVKNDSDIEVTPYYVPRDTFPGSITAGPYYKTYTNKTEREAANAIVAWVATKVPGFLSKNVYFNYVFNKLTGWVSSAFSPTYVGVWQSKSYNSNIKLYEYHNTIVHYTSSSYSTPKNVSYYVVYRDTK